MVGRSTHKKKELSQSDEGARSLTNNNNKETDVQVDIVNTLIQHSTA